MRSAIMSAKQVESSSEESSSDEEEPPISSSPPISSDEEEGVSNRPATVPARRCESSSEDLSSDSEESDGVSNRPATVPALQSATLLPPWWPTSSVETEAGRKFWQTPELVDKLMLMLDVRSMLSLAEVQPLAVRILRAGSQPWKKLIKDALDNPFIKYVHGPSRFQRQRTLVQKISTTVLAKMESRRPLLMELLDLICAKYNAEERPIVNGQPMFRTRDSSRLQVSCPHHVSHTVTAYGFILLEDCEGTIGSSEQNLVSIGSSEGSSQLSGFELPSVSSRLSRQQRRMESLQLSQLSFRSKDLVDALLNVLQNCDQARGLQYVSVYDDIGTGGWEALAEALRLHQPYKLKFTSSNNLMMHARTEDLRIIWDAMLEGSDFKIDIKDVVTETQVGATKHIFKGPRDVDNEKNWAGLLKCLEGTRAQAERRSCLRPRTADFNPFGENTKIW